MVRTLPSQPYDVVQNAIASKPYQILAFGPTALGTLTGTQATNAATLNDLFTVPGNHSITITGVRAKRGVGGTMAATSPHWGIAHSLAGTGANTVFGTLVSGTYADNTYAAFSVTSTDIPSANVVRLVAIAGTSNEETQTLGGITIEYMEDWA